MMFVISLLFGLSIFGLSIVFFSQIQSNIFSHAGNFIKNSWYRLFYFIVKRWGQKPGFLRRFLQNDEKIEKLLQHSGLNHTFTLAQYSGLKHFMVFVLSWIMFTVILLKQELFFFLLIEIILIILIFKIPDFFLFLKASRRARQADQHLPNFLDMLIMSTESGMNFINAFRFVAERTKGILGKEAQLVLRQIDFGFPFEKAFSSLPSRLNCEELLRLHLSMKQAKTLGVSLAETLKIQAQMIRNRRRQKAEELSKTAAVKIAIPLVFFIFPALLILYLAPGILRLFLGV